MKKNVVQIIFVQGDNVLMGFRQNTEALNNLWAFPSGRIEQAEQPEAAAKRESLEEVGVNPTELKFLAPLPDPLLDIQHYLYIFEKWQGTVVNAEPHLCRELAWFKSDRLPKPYTPITKQVIALYQRSINSR